MKSDSSALITTLVLGAVAGFALWQNSTTTSPRTARSYGYSSQPPSISPRTGKTDQGLGPLSASAPIRSGTTGGQILGMAPSPNLNISSGTTYPSREKVLNDFNKIANELQRSASAVNNTLAASTLDRYKPTGEAQRIIQNDPELRKNAAANNGMLIGAPLFTKKMERELKEDLGKIKIANPQPWPRR